MAEVRNLAKPPIQEALMDFVLAPAAVDRSGLEAIAQSLVVDGWEMQPITTFKAEFGTSDEGSEEGFGIRGTSKAVEGFAIRRADGEVIFQVRPDRVTVSHVNSYGCWEDLQADADRVLKAHCAVSGAPRIQRMAARFINRLRLKEPKDDFSLLAHAPLLPLGVDDANVEDFMSRQVLKGFAGGLTANLTIGTVSPLPGDEFDSLLIDVDVFKICDEPADISVVHEQLLAIRDVKNRLFFGSLNDSALESYV